MSPIITDRNNTFSIGAQSPERGRPGCSPGWAKCHTLRGVVEANIYWSSGQLPERRIALWVGKIFQSQEKRRRKGRGRPFSPKASSQSALDMNTTRQFVAVCPKASRGWSSSFPLPFVSFEERSHHRLGFIANYDRWGSTHGASSALASRCHRFMLFSFRFARHRCFTNVFRCETEKGLPPSRRDYYVIAN